MTTLFSIKFFYAILIFASFYVGDKAYKGLKNTQYLLNKENSRMYVIKMLMHREDLFKIILSFLVAFDVIIILFLLGVNQEIAWWLIDAGMLAILLKVSYMGMER